MRKIPHAKYNLHNYNGHGGQGVPPCVYVKPLQVQESLNKEFAKSDPHFSNVHRTSLSFSAWGGR